MTRTKAQKAKAKARAKGRNQQGGNQANRPMLRRVGGLDADALKYARLLNDPCEGPLVHPLYEGVDGGILFRAESDFLYGGGATDTSTMGCFCPAALYAPYSGQGSVLVASTTGDSVPAILGPNGIQPGAGFVAGSSKAVRMVSACVQIMWPGSELSRAGVVALGQTTFGELNGASVTTAGLRALAQNVARMPDGMLELKIVPNASSAIYLNPNISGGGPLLGMPALFWSVSGIPVNTGIRIRCVCVYEFQLTVGSGGTQTYTNNPSKNRLDDVLQYLESTGNWAYNATGKAMSAVSSMYGAFGNAAMLANGIKRMAIAL